MGHHAVTNLLYVFTHNYLIQDEHAQAAMYEWFVCENLITNIVTKIRQWCYSLSSAMAMATASLPRTFHWIPNKTVSSSYVADGRQLKCCNLPGLPPHLRL